MTNWDSKFEQIIRSYLSFLPPEEQLDEETPLREYGLDSLGIVELLSTLESEYNLRFSEEDLMLETFANPGVLWRSLTRLLSATG